MSQLRACAGMRAEACWVLIFLLLFVSRQKVNKELLAFDAAKTFSEDESEILR